MLIIFDALATNLVESINTVKRLLRQKAIADLVIAGLPQNEKGSKLRRSTTKLFLYKRVT